MRVACPGGDETGLGSLLTGPGQHSLATATVHGTGEADSDFSLPYHGERLRGDALARRLDTWEGAGVVEPTCAEAIRAVAGHPEWLRLPGQTVAVLGAGAEIGPLPVLLGWGARVAGVNLPHPPLWDRVLRTAQDGGGPCWSRSRRSRPIAMRPARGPWGSGQASIWSGTSPLPLTGSRASRARWCWATTSTPPARRTWQFLPPWTRSPCAFRPRGTMWRSRSWPHRPMCSPWAPMRSLSRPAPMHPVEQGAKLARPLRTLSGGRLLRRAYLPGADPGVSDSLVAQQGPNYALAKRLQRWRAALARDGGATVSLNVAPPTRTRSVMTNRVLAAAYAGAHRFGVEVFEPATCKVLMAALLVHDLHTGGGPAHAHPWQDEADAAAPGGLWRMAYAPRSALGLAALLGYGAART